MEEIVFLEKESNLKLVKCLSSSKYLCGFSWLVESHLLHCRSLSLSQAYQTQTSDLLLGLLGEI